CQGVGEGGECGYRLAAIVTEGCSGVEPDLRVGAGEATCEGWNSESWDGRVPAEAHGPAGLEVQTGVAQAFDEYGDGGRAWCFVAGGTREAHDGDGAEGVL